MIALTLAEIRDLTGGRVVGTDAPDDVVVDGVVTTDSRDCTPGSLYVARVGEHADGHAYVASAVAAGAVAALTSREVDGRSAGRRRRRADRLRRRSRAASSTGLRSCASSASPAARARPRPRTCSPRCSSRVAETVAPVNSLNGEIGVPLTVCRVTPTTRFLVAEMGARGIGHIDYLTRIAPPQVAIVLNVGTAHVGEFGSRENIALAKAELPRAVPAEGLAVLNADDPLVAGMREGLACRVQLVGLSPEADVRAEDVVLDERGRAAYTLVAPAGSAPDHVAAERRPSRGQLARRRGGGPRARAVARPGRRRASAAEAVSRWRMELTERPDGVLVVNDAYNANPDSMRAALDAVAAMAVDGRRWAVLGGMLELGDDSDAEHAAVGAYAARARHRPPRGRGGGGPPRRRGVPRARSGCPTPTRPTTCSKGCSRAGDVVLLKSSRDSGLRWLGDRLAGRDACHSLDDKVVTP